MQETQSEIKLLKFPDNIRQNPQFMLGDLRDSSLLFRELFDNARDELIASATCDTVWCDTQSEFHVVADNGRGISVALTEDGITQMELAVGSIYSSGKYDSKIAQGGMHGVGSSCVNAVSDLFKIACKITSANYDKSYDFVKSKIKKSKVDLSKPHLGYWLLVEYKKGIKTDCKVVNYEELKAEFYNENLPNCMSTIVGFTADLTLVSSNKVTFSNTWSDYTSLALREFFNKEIKLYVDNELVNIEFKPYKYEMLKEVQLADPGINKTIKAYITFEFDKDLSVKDFSGSVNLITVNHGLHLSMAKFAITNKLKMNFGIQHKFLDNGLKFTVVILANRVHYDSQTKTRLVSIDNLSDADWYAFDDLIDSVFAEHHEEIKAHVEALNELAASYENISKREYVMSMININTQGGNRAKSFQPIKLIDASSENRESCELFLAEGDSAGGTIVKVRNPEVHAIMPLRGVSLNTVWMDFDAMSENQEIMDIISAIGTGVDDIYDLEALRYDKIIIASDADPDGLHITAILLGLFASHMKFLVDAGKLYVLQSPLYKQDGKYIYQEDIETLDKSRPFERFKGLGSLQATDATGRQEIKDIFLNNDTRHLIKVTSEHFERAIAAVGDKYTRKILMQSRKLV